jgi:hypothetical protein
MSRERQATGLQRIERVARQAERRIRGLRGLRSASNALCAALGVAILDVALRKVGVVGELGARMVLGAALASAAITGGVAYARRLPDRAGARALDRFHGWHDRLGSALAFGERPADERTSFTDAAIDDAVALASGARPARAVPIVLPRALAVAAGLAGVCLGVMLFEVRHHGVVAHARTIDPIEMAPDDLEDVKDFLKQIRDRGPGDDVKVTIEEFNKLVDDIASERLDRTEVFRRLEALDQKLATASATDSRVLEQQLEAMGNEMRKAELTRSVGVALSDNELPKAREALHELAKKLRGSSASVDKSKLDQMRVAIQRTIQRAQERQNQLERRRQQLADEILKTKQNHGDAGVDEEPSLLDKKQAELDRLDRDLSEQQGAGQQLDRLDRDLQQAAEDLMKDLGVSALDLDQGAEDLNRLQQQEMSQQQKEDLRQKLQEMRELLRQQGQSGGSQVVRLKRFGRMARGQSGQPGSQGGASQSGDSPGGEGDRAQGPPGQTGGSGAQGQGQGPGSGGSPPGNAQGGEAWIVGPHGEKILMFSEARARSGAEGDGTANPSKPGAPGRWGEGHDPHVQGQPTHTNMGTEDTQVQGADSAQGGTRSQVILGAAERGFASRPYQKVFTEYHQVAEESLAKDEIPGGYRFYVKRYFELIRPREAP